MVWPFERGDDRRRGSTCSSVGPSNIKRMASTRAAEGREGASMAAFDFLLCYICRANYLSVDRGFSAGGSRGRRLGRE